MNLDKGAISKKVRITWLLHPKAVLERRLKAVYVFRTQVRSKRACLLVLNSGINVTSDPMEELLAMQTDVGRHG
jgi:hypothetical protein